jgi:predicted ATPase
MALKPSGVVIELIETLGYTCLDEEIHAFAGDYFNVLMEGSALIDQAVMTLKKKTMSKEELAK